MWRVLDWISLRNVGRLVVALLLGLIGRGGARANPPPPPAAVGNSMLAKIFARGVVRVGMCPGLTPFVVEGKAVEELTPLLDGAAIHPTLSVDGRKLAGFDVELAAEVAKALGARLEIVVVDSFEALLPGLVEGRYDFVASGLTRTLQRATKVAFSDPYFSSGIEILVRDAKRHDSVASLNVPASRVAYRRGTTAELLVERRLDKVTRVPIESREAIFAAFDDPTISAVVVDTLVARDAEVRKRAKTVLTTLEDRRFSTEHLAIAVPLGEPDWLGWINLFLRESKSQGAFHRAAARYNAWFRTER